MSVFSKPFSKYLMFALIDRRFRSQAPQYSNKGMNFLRNGGKFISSSKPPLIASFVWGLRQTRTNKKQTPIKTVVREVKKVFPVGGTIVMQIGWWQQAEEKSARITIENNVKDTKLTDEKFKAKIEGLIAKIADKYGQEVLFLDYYRGTRKLKSLQYVWHP